MAKTTNYLNLTLPENGEYDDTWNEPINANFETIDAKTQDIAEEIQIARGNKGSLNAFLAVGHDSDGNILPTKEISYSRSSPVYGHRKENGELSKLYDRLSRSEREIWWAREGALDLRASVAQAKGQLFPVILSGSKNLLGYPSWLGSSAGKAAIDGSTIPLKVLINGQVSQVRTKVELTPAAAGTYFVQAAANGTGAVIIDGTSGTPEGTTSQDVNAEMTIFSATGVTNWVTAGVRVGDILEIVGNSLDAGSYVIKEVAVSGDTTKLKVFGLFPTGGLSSLQYKIYDPLGATITLEQGENNSSTVMCIGEVDYDGTAITAVRPRAFGDTFVGEWRAINVGSGTTGLFEETYTHGFGTNNLDVHVQVSQTSTDKGTVEDLPMVSLVSTLSLSNTLSVVGATLSGSVSLTGSVAPTHGCVCRWDGQKVYIKNAVPDAFYTDYAAAVKQTGYLRVVVRRRA